MDRLTTNKKVSDMGMTELALNCCYISEDGTGRYRDYEMDMDERDFARNLMTTLTGEDLPLEDETFDEEMMDNLMIDAFADVRGLIALFYRNMWTMAELREALKRYEDAEEQGLLMRLPCKVGDKVWYINKPFILEYEVTGFSVDKTGAWLVYVEHHADQNNKTYGCNLETDDLGIKWFLQKEEAEAKLKEMI